MALQEWTFEQEGKAADLNNLIAQYPETVLYGISAPWEEFSTTQTASLTDRVTQLLITPNLDQVLQFACMLKSADAAATATLQLVVANTGRSATDTIATTVSTSSTTYVLKTINSIDMINLVNVGDSRGRDVYLDVYLWTSNASYAASVKEICVIGQDTLYP